MDAPNHFSKAATTFCAAIALFVGAVGIASAQTMPAASPSPTSSPAGQTSPSGANNPTPPNTGGQPTTPTRPVAAAPAMSHLPIIDFVVTFTQPAYYTNMSQLPAYDPVDLGGTVRIPVTRKFSLSFDRITEGSINQPLEQQLLPGLVLPKDTRDVILQYHGTYAMTRQFTIDVGDSFRHRQFASGSGTKGALLTQISSRPFPYTLASSEHHYGYVGFTYTTKPVKELFNSSFAIAETVEAQNVDHHVATLCSAANVASGQFGCRTAGTVGYIDERRGTDRFYETTQGVTWIVPVDPKHGTTFTLNERWGYSNFYENSPYPWRWASLLAYQLNKRFSPGFTLSMRHQDQHEALVGSPFAGGGFIHVGSWDVFGTFHLDTNTLFH